MPEAAHDSTTSATLSVETLMMSDVTLRSDAAAAVVWPRGRAASARRLWLLVGPGVLFASASVGVSHLVQCTRGGYRYGFEPTWVILVCHAAKFPFFEFSYDEVYIGAKGYMNFGGLDKQIFPSLDRHRLMPRVAPLFADMDALDAHMERLDGWGRGVEVPMPATPSAAPASAPASTSGFGGAKAGGGAKKAKKPKKKR